MVYILNTYDKIVDFSENVNIIGHDFHSGNFSIVKLPNKKKYLLVSRLVTNNVR